MQSFVLIILFLISLFSMTSMASEFLNYVNGPTFLFTYGLTLLFTALAFGVEGLTKALMGLKYLFAREFVGGKQAIVLTKIYENIVKFSYGSAFIVFLIGLIALISGSGANREISHLLFLWENAISVMFMPFLYAAILCEGIIRPLKVKLENCDLVMQ